MDSLRQDLVFAARSLLKAPGFTAIAALCLALGIAANVFVYSPVNAIMIRPLPYKEPDRLMHVNTWRTTEPRLTWANWSYSDYKDVGTLNGTFSEVGLYRTRDWNVGGIAEPERISGARVTASLFPMLGLQPAFGRFFRPDEDLDGKVVVLSHGLWQRKFGGDSSIVGSAVTVDGAPYSVVGVMEEKVRFPEVEDIWLPLEPPATWRDDRGFRAYQMTARLAAGVSMESANERIAAFMANVSERFPDTNRNMSAWMWPLSEDVASEVRPIFLTMVGAVVFVLLIACSNVANLLLARGSTRQRELAVRFSMGATRSRIVRQMLTESALLAIIGGVLGVLGGVWGTELFLNLALPDNVPFWMNFSIDSTVLVLTLIATVSSGLVFGIVPALQLSRPELSNTLKESGGRGGSASRRIGRVRSTLVVVQLAMSLVLLAGATLMMKSFLNSRTADLGFQPDGVLTSELALVGERYATDSARLQSRRTLLGELQAIPQVENAAAVGWIPVGSCCTTISYVPEGKTYQEGEVPSALYNGVTSEYFATMKRPLLSGRAFNSGDLAGTQKVVIVNESFAQREWPGVSAVGRRITFDGSSDPFTIVGIVANVVPRKLGDVFERQHQVYVPLEQTGWTSFGIVMRTSGDPSALVSALREVVRRFDPDLPVARIATMNQVISDRMFEGRVYGTMFTVFGVAALLLATIGLYGVMSYVASQRTQEVGVRLALGAQKRDVISLLVGSGARLVILGLGIGLPLAIGLAQLLRGSLYGVSPTDPATFVAIPVVLSLVALVASFVPARRATRVDPVVALRSE